MEELLGVMWAIRTSSRGITNETPLSIVYKTKVVIYIEVRVPTMRSVLTEDQNALEYIRCRGKHELECPTLEKI